LAGCTAAPPGEKRLRWAHFCNQNVPQTSGSTRKQTPKMRIKWAEKYQMSPPVE